MEINIQEKLKTGLTAAEVAEKQARGLVNTDLNIKTKSYGRIICDNIFSLFNLINTILLVCILITGSVKNALFYAIVIWNFALGCIQEIRAKRVIDRLSLLTAPKAFAIRDGAIVQIASNEIVLGEIVELKSGNQVCADCVALDGACTVNESLVTGESDPVTKKAGDHIISGSFITSGSVRAEVEHIGADNYVNRITLGAKYTKKSNSIIMDSLRSVIKVVVIALIPLAGLMVWKNFFLLDQGFNEAMIATVASVSAMIPGGMILLVSTIMAVSAVKLSRHNTLAQDLYCVESLARVDVVCMDKTGTITEGKMKVVELADVAAGAKLSDAMDCQGSAAPDRQSDVLRQLQFFAGSMDDDNSTINAIREYLAQPLANAAAAEGHDYDASICMAQHDDLHTDESNTQSSPAMPGRYTKLGQVPFSSENKWSLLEVQEGSDTFSMILGAPEIVCPWLKSETDTHKAVQADCEAEVSDAGQGMCVHKSGFSAAGEEAPQESLPAGSEEALGGREAAAGILRSWEEKAYRVVAFAVGYGSFSGGKLPEDIRLKALIAIGDSVRESAAETLQFFREQGVTLKVISGDNPATVSAIAQAAGLEGARQYVDASTLQSYEDISEAIETTAIFGRVTPHQKLDIIKALKANGHFVAMVGDGANDVLALRASDCSIAMQNGSDAARSTSSIVLMNSDFQAIPLIVNEGRKAINNLQRSCSLYLTKTTYAFILTMAFFFLEFTYPFQSVQVTLIGVFTIGMPSFFLALEPRTDRIREGFLGNIFRMAVPGGIVTAAVIIAVAASARNILGASQSQVQTICTFAALLAGLIVLLNISGKKTLWKSAILAFVVACAAGSVLVFPSLFSLVHLSWQMWTLVILSAAWFVVLYGLLFRIVNKKK